MSEPFSFGANTPLTFGIAIVVAAAAIALTGLDRASFAPDEEVAVAAAPATAPDAPPMTLSAAAVRIDPPPHALVCREESAELRVASGAPVDDFLDEFFLVSDPRETCRADGLAAQGGYDPDAGRCYTLRTLGTGVPDLPLVCTEVFRQGPDGVSVSEMRCSGWDRRIQTGSDGGFSLTLAAREDAPPARISAGNCRPL